MGADNFDIYKYYKGEHGAPSEDFVSPLKSAYWNCESWWHLNENKEQLQPLAEYVRGYCNAIVDKWMPGGDFTGEDIYNDYLQPDVDSLKG